MRRCSLSVLGLLVTLACRALSQSPAYRITGVVVNTSSGAPVPYCHLTPTRSGQTQVARRQTSDSVAGVDTDEHGRFTLPLPSAGAWQLVANAPGYTTQAYEEHEGYSSSIVLKEQAPTYDVTFKLPPEARLTGTVLDEAGEAVRNAQVRLFVVPPKSPDGRPVPMNMRSSATTDDRGFYEFANLPPGDYRISVTARPWYTSPVQQRRIDPQEASTASALDPSLDLTYPETWYPGVDDPAQAETISLHAGDSAQAAFHLVPLPAIHLRLILPPNATAASGRAAPYLPTVERVGAGVGMSGFTPVSITGSAQGQIDIGGLSPGIYQIRLQNQNQDTKIALVQVNENGVRTVDFNNTSDEARITIHLDGADDNDSSIQVELIDANTGQRMTQFNQRPGGPMRGRQQEDRPRERTIHVPPGRYEVVLGGKPDIYFDGLSAQSAEVHGRFINVHSGSTTLTVHVAGGKASVRGIATLAGKPAVGAMVLLVPAGLADPLSMTLLARDQTNTDGSYELPAVIPGQYILVAIDHGWQINWRDAATLNQYLIHGVPLELRPGSETRQNIEAQAP